MAGAAPPVLLDVGSAFVRVGFVGEAQPRSVIPSPIGKHLRRPPQQTLRQWQWESILSPFLASLYIDVLHCKPWERNVFLCETLVGCRPLRQAIAEILFSYLSVPSIGILSGPLPSLYCTGSLSGLILDIGQRESHVLAVWRGVPIQASYVVSPAAMLSVTQKMKELLLADDDSEGLPELLKNPEALEEIVTKACLACPTPASGRSHGSPQRTIYTSGVAPMELMLGSPMRRVTVSSQARVDAAEALFYEEGGGIAGSILASILRCPLDIRRVLAGQIIPIGGGSMLPGLQSRLQSELFLLGESLSEAWCAELQVKKPPFPGDSLLWVGASALCAACGSSSSSHSGPKLITQQTFLGSGKLLPDWTSL